MIKRPKSESLYTFMYCKMPKIAKIRNFGGRVFYVSRYTPMVTAMVPKGYIPKLISDPDLVYIAKEQTFSLPFYYVKKVFSPSTMRATQIIRKKKGLLWNIARVLGKGRIHSGKGIRVGVIDTGIDLNHPNLAPNIKGGINIIQPSKPPQDDNGHGTHIAGTIGAIPYQGVVGVAPKVSLYAIKVLNASGTGSLSDLIKGIEWGIANKMDVLNISISGGKKIHPVLEKVVNEAVRRGIIVVAAAGNSGSSSGQGDHVEIPARIASTIAVSALNKANKRAPFSATGKMVDIAAPGVDILSTYRNKKYAVLSGTSMATAHVSGVMALYKAVYPQYSVNSFVKLMAKRAIDLPPKGKDASTGYGLIQVS